MRVVALRAAVPTVSAVAVLLVTGCSSDAPGAAATPTTPTTPKPTASTPTPLTIGQIATYDVTEAAGGGGTTRMSVVFEGIEYLSARNIGATGQPKRGQFVRITLTVKNVGSKNASFRSHGKMKWESDATAPQVVTTTEGVREGADLNTTYKPGQSLNGSFNLDVGAREGKVAYWQNLTDAQPSFVLKLSMG